MHTLEYNRSVKISKSTDLSYNLKKGYVNVFKMPVSHSLTRSRY